MVSNTSKEMFIFIVTLEDLPKLWESYSTTFYSFNPTCSPQVTNINFLPTNSVHNQGERLQEFQNTKIAKGKMQRFFKEKHWDQQSEEFVYGYQVLKG